jgi:hypothetical protein
VCHGRLGSLLPTTGWRLSEAIAVDEVGEVFPAGPQGLPAGFTVVRAAEVAAQPGHSMDEATERHVARRASALPVEDFQSHRWNDLCGRPVRMAASHVPQ